VTLRPRSKLERIVERLEEDRPKDEGEGRSAPHDPSEHELSPAHEVSPLPPSTSLLRIAARLGYPGTSPAALVRALEAELPGGHPHELAARVVRTFERLADARCTPRQPRCAGCPIDDRCAYRGEGVDPAGWLDAHDSRR
jgi:hypothetical protein